MSREKNLSIILSAKPYRETSMLLSLYSLGHGRINAIAKGVRKTTGRSSSGVPIERGYMIEHMVYMKQHRDLHLVTDCQIVEHYPGIRGNLEKTAVRDTVFDIVISAMGSSETNAAFFALIADFLSDLEKLRADMSGHLFFLSETLFSIAGNLGFYLDTSRCAVCGRAFNSGSEMFLAVKGGDVKCCRCADVVLHEEQLMRCSRPLSLQAQSVNEELYRPVLADAVAALRAAVEYCRHHLDLRRKLESYLFIEQLLSDTLVDAPAVDSTRFSGVKGTVGFTPNIKKERTCQFHQ